MEGGELKSFVTKEPVEMISVEGCWDGLLIRHLIYLETLKPSELE